MWHRIRCHEKSRARIVALLSRDGDSSHTRRGRRFCVIYERDRTRLLVLSGLLTAMSIVFSRFLSVQIPLSGIGALRLGFGPLPVIVAGLIGGPAIGAAVGTAADLIGYFINPFGAAFIPHILVVSALTGMAPAALLCLLYPKTGQKPGLLAYLIAIGISQAVLHIGAMSLVLLWVYGIPVQVSLLLRSIAQAILTPIYSILAYAVVSGAYASLAPQRRRDVGCPVFRTAQATRSAPLQDASARRPKR